ncbi:MAG: hypothetical protein GXY74_08900 [Phycisphaerae bacterium]|nr:hypothetical protein [Phycisphaerae bacterium]
MIEPVGWVHRTHEGRCILMASYRQAFVPGGTFLFTAVPLDRRAMLATAAPLRLLG